MNVKRVLCVGEILWDALPEGLFLGGAPFNVACHLRKLGAEVSFASRVGEDELGREAIRRAAATGLHTDLIQADAEHPTGFVRVAFDKSGEPTYEIVAPVAWDFIEVTDKLRMEANGAAAIVFGSLAQRRSVGRETIQQLLATDALKVFDVNLRPPHDDRSLVEASLKMADFVKLNKEELARLTDWFDLPEESDRAVQTLSDRFGCKNICVTAGAKGAWLLHQSKLYAHAGYVVKAIDTVGAGDAFLAALLYGLLRGDAPEATLDHANLLGAFVATQRGAIPDHDPDLMSHIRSLARA